MMKIKDKTNLKADLSFSTVRSLSSIKLFCSVWSSQLDCIHFIFNLTLVYLAVSTLFIII